MINRIRLLVGTIAIAACIVAVALFALLPGDSSRTPIQAGATSLPGLNYVSTDCKGPAASTPSFMSFGCDGGVQLFHLQWPHWFGASSPRGYGKLNANNCKAWCAVGQRHTYDIHIRLEKIEMCPQQLPEFQTAIVTFRGVKPAWAHFRQVFGHLGCTDRSGNVSPPNHHGPNPSPTGK